ncbi:hypothetical protein [Acetobacter cibinongensis]|uniref:DUF2635 domain-containing protein n=1 Tax=Acetobacter cibinongensis TaxID=146475 RepID=A0A1Z5YR51_9PROT|nr:hypothetical protein [Acetobacter cibinongensis]OUI98095.1 hypothetical protein HK14_01080 [Acetobacter cibinongensis]
MTVRVSVTPERVVRDQAGRKCPKGEFAVDEKDFFWAEHIRSGDLTAPAAKEPALQQTAPAADKKA